MLSQDDRHPVQCDNWHDAKAFAARHSKKTNNPYRLLMVASATTTPFGGTSLSAAQAN
jgi:hypothetical protein